MCEPASLTALSQAVASLQASATATASVATSSAGVASAAASGAASTAALTPTITAATTTGLSLAPTLSSLPALGTQIGMGATTASIGTQGALANIGALAGQLAATSVGLGTSIYNSVSLAEQRKNQDKLSEWNAKLQRGQIEDEQRHNQEAASQKTFELARSALADRGVIRSSSLGDRSVRALGRAIGFNLGQDRAVIKRNSEIANQEAAARLTGVALTRQSEIQSIGDTTGLVAGLEIGSAFVRSVPAGVDLFDSLNIQ